MTEPIEKQPARTVKANADNGFTESQLTRLVRLVLLAGLGMVLLVLVCSVRLTANLYSTNTASSLAAVAEQLSPDNLSTAQSRLNEFVSDGTHTLILLRTTNNKAQVVVAYNSTTSIEAVTIWKTWLFPYLGLVQTYALPPTSLYNGQPLELQAWLNAHLILNEVVHNIGPLIIILVGWLFILILLIANYVLRKVTRPIEKLAEALRRINPDQPGKTKIAIEGNHSQDELGQVVTAINALLRQLDHSLQRERSDKSILAERESFLSLVLDNVAEGIVLLGEGYKILRLNQSACTLLGRFETELQNRNFENLLEIVDRATLHTRLSQLVLGTDANKVLSFELRVLKPRQETAQLSLTVSCVQTGTSPVFIILMRDIGETRRVHEKIRLSEERLKLAVKATRCGIWDIELKTSTFWWSPEFLPMLGYRHKEIPASLEAKYALIHPEDIDWVRNSHERYLKREIEEFAPEYRVKRKDGSWMWIEDRGTAEWDDNGEAIRFSGIMSDCTERKRFEKQLMYMATHDPLTELPNRTLLQDRLEHAISSNHRKGLQVGLLLLDIDRFKLINESLGHEIGDQLVRAVSQRLQQNIRPTDTLARLSGDEFVVICEDLPSPQEGARVAKRLLNAMSQHFIVDSNQLSIGISIGISLSPTDGVTPQALLRHADTAMHNAKACGGNCYRFFTSEMNKEAVQRLSLERRLSEAVERQQFILHYQPKVNIITKEVVGAEALIRWPHRSLGNISPLQFIPVAEETGQIMAIGEWVIREALSQICSWRERGLKLVPIAINLSGRQLMASGIDEMILRLLREFEVDPGLLELEITESSVMSRMDKVLPPLLRLREAGVSIALDDFGTGYSSLAYLRQLPITSLKIDRSFVKDVPQKPEACPLIAIIVEVGRHLGLTVVAEGVETEEQREFLRKQMEEIICQGWLFHKALPASKFEKLLAPATKQP